ncbi:hypothetical protein SFRURICE_012751 [Spodoptera frugiperda]|nr:hypothetical protein SFRURICE_012751 [Spodoptera frugiperda]
MARWLGNWPPYNVSRLRFPHGTILCVIHRLLFRVWVSCACELLCRLTVAKLKGWRMAMIRKDTGGTRV